MNAARALRLIVTVAATVTALATAATPTALASAAEKSVWIAEIRGAISPATSDYLSAALHRAEADQAEALIVELDTPGGLVSSVREMAQTVDRAKIPVVVYVAPAGASATSAGALLTLASHLAAMAPGTNIGAAHPVGNQGEDIPGAMGEKAVNDIAAMARGLAELRGRNAEIAGLIVSKSASLTAQEALSKKVIEIIAVDRQDLLQKMNGREIRLAAGTRVMETRDVTIKKTEMTIGQRVLSYLANPNIATLLISLGMLLIYVELSHPGGLIAGILGGICLITAFISFQLLPIQIGGLLLLSLGVILFLAEPFVVSHGALAAGGLISFVLGILWVIDPSETSLRISPAIWVPLVIGLGSAVFLLSYSAARTRKLVKKTLSRIGGGAAYGLSGYPGEVQSVSEDGLSGKALFRGEIWDFESRDPVRVGDWVEVSGAHPTLMKVFVFPTKRP